MHYLYSFLKCHKQYVALIPNMSVHKYYKAVLLGSGDATECIIDEQTHDL